MQLKAVAEAAAFSSWLPILGAGLRYVLALLVKVTLPCFSYSPQLMCFAKVKGKGPGQAREWK